MNCAEVITDFYFSTISTWSSNWSKGIAATIIMDLRLWRFLNSRASIGHGTHEALATRPAVLNQFVNLQRAFSHSGWRNAFPNGNHIRFLLGLPARRFPTRPGNNLSKWGLALKSLNSFKAQAWDSRRTCGWPDPDPCVASAVSLLQWHH